MSRHSKVMLKILSVQLELGVYRKDLQANHLRIRVAYSLRITLLLVCMDLNSNLKPHTLT